jgi:hypothetical protein
MSPMEVVIKELQTDQRIPRGIPFRKSMRFTSEGIEPITQGAVDPLNVNGTRFRNDFPKDCADLDRKKLSMLITMFDGLRQAHLWRHHE